MSKPSRIHAFRTAIRKAFTRIAQSGQAQALPFTTIGRVTGAERVGGDLKLMLGQLQVGFDKLRSLSTGS